MSIRRISLVLGLIGTQALVACGGGDGGTGPVTPVAPSTPTVAGTFVLQTVDGKTLPAVASENSGGKRQEVLSDSVMLNANLTWTESGEFRVTNLSTGAVTTETRTGNGTYTESSGTVRFYSPSVSTFTEATVTGSGSGSTMTLVAATKTYVYVKR